MQQAAEIDAERFSLAELGPGDDALEYPLRLHRILRRRDSLRILEV
jgi:hypothetical protein